MLFWIFAAVVIVIVALLLVLPLLRGGSTAPAAAHDLAFHRAALDEIARDEARGVLSKAEAERARTEVSRRLLDADRRLAQAGGDGLDAPRLMNSVAAVVIALSLGAAGLGLYAVLGAPGMGDRPRAARIAEARSLSDQRPSQEEAETARPAQPDAGAGNSEMAALIERLRDRLEETPGDARGWSMLARSEAARGRFRAAYEAQERLIELLGTDATAGDFATLADLKIRAAGGIVTAEAEEAIGQALMREPRNGIARYYRGLLEAQTGRPERAFAVWRPLLEESQPDAPWTAPLRELIGQVAAQAGIDYTPPSAGAPPGPDAAQMAAAAEMSDEERQQMIRGMVGRLAGRLQSEGGTAAEWARLIRAYGVLGETGKAREAATQARAALSDTPGALETVNAAARAAGVAAPGE